MKPERTIIVTGGAGFIGSNFLNAMVVKYPAYRFVNIDLLTYAADRSNLTIEDAPNYAFEHADIRDEAAMTQIFDVHTPTDIIHFAAESHVDNSIAGPRVFVETNILGAQILLDLARNRSIRRFHHISTDEVYGSLGFDDPATTEHAQIAPRSPYSASKAGADHLVLAYHETFGLDAVLTRASNNYGPHQHAEKLIPRFIARLLSGGKVPLYGSGTNVRDWLYVGDHVDAIDRVFHSGKSGEVYNVGGGNERTNTEITYALLALSGLGKDHIEHVTDRLGHDLRYALDTTKIEHALGWHPKTPFEKGLAETFAYYKKRFDEGKLPVV